MPHNLVGNDMISPRGIQVTQPGCSHLSGSRRRILVVPFLSSQDIVGTPKMSPPHLLCFTNCTYNLLTGEVSPKGTADVDDASLNTGYDFYTRTQLKKENPERYQVVKEDRKLLDRVLDQIFPDPSIRDYMLLFAASCLSGEVNQEHVHFFTGASTNGKSYYDGLCASVFGQYWASGHPTLLLKPREESNACNAPLTCLQGKRMITFQELDTSNGVKLNMATLIRSSSSDTISCRPMFAKESTTFQPQFKFIVSVNEIPPMSQDDSASRRHIRVVPFLSKFVEDPETQDLRLPFMWKLMDYYEKYKQAGKVLVETDGIRHATEVYFRSQDIVGQWVENTLERDPDCLFYTEMSPWILTKKELMANMTSDLKEHIGVGGLIGQLDKPDRLGPMITSEAEINGEKVNNYWKGWRIKQGSGMERSCTH